MPDPPFMCTTANANCIFPVAPFAIGLAIERVLSLLLPIDMLAGCIASPSAAWIGLLRRLLMGHTLCGASLRDREECEWGQPI